MLYHQMQKKISLALLLLKDDYVKIYLRYYRKLSNNEILHFHHVRSLSTWNYLFSTFHQRKQHLQNKALQEISVKM